MHRTTTAALVAVGLMNAGFALSQAPATIPSDLKFEVASLKPSKPGGRGMGIRPAAGGQRYEASNCPVKLMIQAAYRLKAEQILGGPGWLESDRFDMEAKAERQSNLDELHVMLMNLLVERFHLKFHKEKKEIPMYALTVDKGGAKVTPHEAANAGDLWIDQTIDRIVHVKMKATFAPMDYFAFRLSQLMDRPVVDLTNLKGGYDFNLEYTRDLPPGVPENAQLNGAPIDTSGPTVFAAVKRQLGLELKAQKGPVDIIVIDHVEKPTEN
jgi:uncharacterized protein (TIGR03435 family)